MILNDTETARQVTLRADIDKIVRGKGWGRWVAYGRYIRLFGEVNLIIPVADINSVPDYLAYILASGK